MAVLTREITADNFMDFAQLPENADRHIELVEGEIVEMPACNLEHAQIESRLDVIIGSHVMRNNLGRTYSGNAAIVLERSDRRGDTLRGLDFAFVSYERSPLRPVSPMEIAPDLAIEVMSPSNTVPDIRRKIAQLINAGCPHVWIVHPDMREVDIHTADGMKTFREGDTLSAPDILPGLEIAVSDIFPD